MNTTTEPKYTCQNCEQEWTQEELKPIKELFQRVAIGEEMPAGECPQCGALCHETEKATASTSLPLADLIAQLRSHRIQIFAEFFEERWPVDVPDTCDAAAADTDCVELKLPEEQYCLCCQMYARICREWYAKPEIQQRLSA